MTSNTHWFWFRCIALGAAAAAAAAMFGGCVTQEVPQHAPIRTTSTAAQPVEPEPAKEFSPNATTVNPDELLNTDPSAVRLENIQEALLEYCAVHDRLPAKLDDLQSMVSPPSSLKLTAPGSNQPYVYVPDGLYAPSHSKRIIVYAPTATPAGKRWCILMPDLRSPGARSFEVKDIPEALFQRSKPMGK
jgi:hypothetical protein